MKLLCIAVAVTLLLCSCAPPASLSAAEDERRSIYPGDIIVLQIAAGGFGEAELREKFRHMEILGIEKGPAGYLVSLRTFDPGEYRVVLGDKEIIIEVRSTLWDIEREDIFEGGSRVADTGFPYVRHSLIAVLAVAILLPAGVILLISLRRRRKPGKQAPLKLFLKRARSLKAEDDSYLVDLTYYFKEFLESKTGRRIAGKTTSEIACSLRGHGETLIDKAGRLNLPEIEGWLMECDRLKFSGIFVPPERKLEHCSKLIRMVERI